MNLDPHPTSIWDRPPGDHAPLRREQDHNRKCGLVAACVVLGVQVLAYLGVKGRDRAGMDHHHRADRLHGDAQTGE